jgi:hypothetical protein
MLDCTYNKHDNNSALFPQIEGGRDADNPTYDDEEDDEVFDAHAIHFSEEFSFVLIEYEKKRERIHV